ncbi:hypothetical protein EDB94_3100 [Marinobacter sp. 3-2]|jgi:hypothetical protein|uniref:hypothetical protein n=1 Tax=Marinobacter sp. 3-2 TaxID=2485141 RepID=UPI000D37FDB8|nr:hypothetical protein [Marinobacter sp. 3-2]ROQ42884.1 hypothetical protein EDB94_3100 [Marinobacter sp. 3-2]
MIEPFFFDESRLFGCYSSATDPNADTVVVVCPPLFDEYRRTYRALSELSVAIAERGVHAFRFDYFGTAESQGLLSETSIEGWLTDIGKAIDEALSVSGADQVVLLGVRFGATMAAQIRHRQVKKWLFWDPVLSGQQYSEWLAEVDRILYQRHQSAARENNVRFEDIPYHNFELPALLISEMKELAIPESTLNDPARAFTVSTDPHFCEKSGLSNCMNPGLTYDWPYYHDGVITQKPVLEALLERVTK